MPSRRFSMRDRVWDVYAQKIIQSSGITEQILPGWSAEKEGSAKLLESIIANLPPNRWMQLNYKRKEEIMRELVYIDGGRGEIVNWLDSIIRQENDVNVLVEAGQWKPRGYAFPGVLLEAWKHKIGSHSARKNVETALEVIVGATLPGGEVPEHPKWKSWDERQRARTILKCLADRGHNAVELGILSKWVPPPGFDGGDILLEMVRQWEKWMSSVVIARDGKLADWRMQDGKYRVAVWKGLSESARHCPGNEGWKIALSWLKRLKHWLVNDWDLEMLEAMGRYSPPEGKLQEEWVEVWSDCLTSFPGCLKWPAWQVVGRYLAENSAEDRKASPHVQKIAANYLKALHELAGKVPKLDAPEEVLNAIIPFRGFTPRQQKEWDTLWIGLLSSGRSSTLGAVTRHLLSLATSGQSDHRRIREAILKKLVKKIPAKAVVDMLMEIRKWEGEQVTPGGLFHEALQQLRRCQQWNCPEIRFGVISQLLNQLKSTWQNGERFPELEKLWFEILRDEKDQQVMEKIPWWKIRSMKGVPTDVLRELAKVGKERAEAACPKMRRCAWMILKESGEDEEVISLLTGFWEREEDLEVVEMVASWKPSSGKHLPTEFYEGWQKCFERLLQKAIQNGWSDHKVHEIVGAVECLSENLMAMWWEENIPGMERHDEAGKMQSIREAVVKNVPKELRNHVQERMEKKRREMEILLSLDDPPETFQSRLQEGNDEHFIRRTVLFILAYKRCKLQKLENITLNTKHNLGLIMVYGLKDYADYHRESALEVLQRLWGDLTWTPDRMPGGWEEFCDFFMHDQKLNKILFPEIIEVGYAVNDFRCRRDFCQRLDSIRCSGKTSISNLAEVFLWREVVIQVEALIAAQLTNKRAKLDTAGERRWLRQFILSFENVSDGREDEKGAKGKTEIFVNVLWKSIFPHVTESEECGKMGREMIKKLGLDGREINFHHPHRTVIHNAGKLNSIYPKNKKSMSLE